MFLPTMFLHITIRKNFPINHLAGEKEKAEQRRDPSSRCLYFTLPTFRQQIVNKRKP